MVQRIRTYFVSATAELSKVIWPSRREVVNHTLIIAVAVVVTIIFLGLVDYGLTILLKNVILNQI